MTHGIVGAEAAKFTKETEQQARELIRMLLKGGVTKVVSGACELGGIDVWAIEEARALGIETEEFPPLNREWNTGFKPRNLQIVAASNIVTCIAVRELPATYHGRRFPLCYHCGTNEHIKSGGCWTVKEARKAGKPGAIVIVG